MSNFIVLKEECARKLKKISALTQNISIDLIFRDINRYMDKAPNRLVRGKEGSYILDGKISMYVTGDGCLDIMDDRATGYGWTFEIGFKEGLRTGEWFEHEGRLYSVSRLSEDAFQGSRDVLRQISQELDEALEILKENKDLDFWKYTYSCEAEDIVCNNFEQVMEAVVKRKPIFC